MDLTTLIRVKTNETTEQRLHKGDFQSYFILFKAGDKGKNKENKKR